MNPIFSGIFTFTAHLWSHDGVESDHPMPLHLALQGVVQALRAQLDARSAQVCTWNSAGERVTWGISINWVGGGSTSYHEFGPMDAGRVWTRNCSKPDVASIEITRWEGGRRLDTIRHAALAA
jgi:hypothetical protein